MTPSREDPVDQLLEIGLKDLWYPICPTGFIKESPVSLRRLGRKFALWRDHGGKLVALGVTEAKRSPVAPEIPTLAEQGIPGVSVTSWYGLLAPAGTPPAVAEQLARDAAEILATPEVRERLKAQGMTDASMKPAEFAAAIRDETAVWAKIIKARNIVAE